MHGHTRVLRSVLALQSITRELWWKARRSSWTRGPRARPENLRTSSLVGVIILLILPTAHTSFYQDEGLRILLSHARVCADASLREVGLNLAVTTMRKGERCHLRVQPQYGYGDRGECLLDMLYFALIHPRCHSRVSG